MFVCMLVAAALTAGVLKKLNRSPRLWVFSPAVRAFLAFSTENCLDIYFFSLAVNVQVVWLVTFVMGLIVYEECCISWCWECDIQYAC